MHVYLLFIDVGARPIPRPFQPVSSLLYKTLLELLNVLNTPIE